MNTFVRALYMLVVETVLLPFQLLALVGVYIYLVMVIMSDYELTFGKAVKLAGTGFGEGAANVVKIIMNYVKTGETTF